MMQTAADRRLERHFECAPWSAPDLLAAEFPEPRWAVPGVLAEGLNLLAGSPKVGKSWLALGVAASVAAGGRALGRIDVDPGPVLYLALEDTPRRLQRRLRMVLGGEPAPRPLHFVTSWPRLPEGGADRLADWLAEHPGTRLVVVDVLARMRGIPSRDAGNVYAADYEALGPLKAVADEFSTALLVLHHTRKQGASDFVETVSGTYGIAGSADAILVMARARNAADAVLHVSGRDVEEAKHAMSFDATRGTWTLLDQPAAVLDLGDTRRRIIELVTDVGPLRPSEMAERLDIKPDLARQTAKRMADDDQLAVSNGVYSLPPVPLSLLSPESPPEPLHSDLSDSSDTLPDLPSVRYDEGGAGW